MNRTAICSLALLAALAAGCHEKKTEGPGPRETNVDKPRDISTDPATWAPNFSPEQNSKDTFVVTDSIVIQDTEANAKTELQEKAYKRAVELTIKDLLRDDDKWTSNENEMRRLFVNQFGKYIVDAQVLQQSRFGDGRQLGVKIKFNVARGALAKAMQQEGMYRDDQGTMKAIVIFRKPQTNAEDVNALAEGYLEDLAENLSREMADRQFQPILWRDVRNNIAQKRDGGDKNVNDILTKYVEESEWRKTEDERYALPMILLRCEGRVMCGFRILELEKRDLSYHCTIRVDAYDLFNQTSLGSIPISNRRAINSGETLLEARQAAVTDTSKKAMAQICDSLQDFLDQQRKLKRKAPAYTFTFAGYNEGELARIESLLAGVIAEDIDVKNDGTQVVARAKIERAVIPVRDEVIRSLKLLGLASKPARRDGNNMTFVKE